MYARKNLAKLRLNEIKFNKKNHQIFWYNSTDKIKKIGDLVIIATLSQGRANLIINLLKMGHKKFLIEKPVCQSKQEFDTLLKNMKFFKATGWVNTRTETEIETGAEDPLPSPPQNRPAKEMHDRWVGRAKALADGAKKSNNRVNVSQIARTIEREDRKIKDENTKGLVRETVTIRRVLTDRRNEWDLPLES